MIGRKIAQYEILAELGRGGMGVVYLARDSRLDCPRALKFLPPTSENGRYEQMRLVTEARSLAALEHPHICPVHEIGTHDDQTFIVMSYLAGETLKRRLRSGPLPLDRALDIARQVGEGLAVAHARGVVHRDIKPDNVMLVPPGEGVTGIERAVIMDFGLAKMADATQVTRTGAVMGTVAYMSPEQARGEPVDGRTDIWSLGVMLHEMVTGSLPFRAANPAALIHAIANEEPEPLSMCGAEIPPGLQDVVDRALEKNRDERYGEAAVLVADLENVSEGSTVHLTGRLPIRRRRRRRRALAAVAAVLLVLIAGYIGWRSIGHAEAAITSLAILPLADRSEAGDQAYFCQGVAEELTTRLQKIGALTIISSRSVEEARRIYGSNREIAARLDVDGLIEGSVQRIGDRARVSLELVAAGDDRLIWSESYTRDIRDVFSLQSEIALAVATALAAKLTPQEAAQLSGEREVVPAAYEEYLLGNFHAARLTAAELRIAIEHYERAAVLDSGYAEPHVATASALGLLRQMASLPPEEVGNRAKAQLQRALEIDPNLGIAYEMLAIVACNFELDLKAAGVNFARARERDPSLRSDGYAQYLNAIDRHAEALREQQEVVRRDPLDSFERINLAERYHVAGQLDAARAEAEKVQQRDPRFWLTEWLLGKWHLEAGEATEAVAALERAVAYSDSSQAARPDLAYAYLLAGRREDAEVILGDFEARATGGYVPPFYLAMLYAAFDRPDDAFAALDAAYAERDFLLISIGYLFSALDKLKDDPRWHELTARIGLPDA